MGDTLILPEGLKKSAIDSDTAKKFGRTAFEALVQPIEITDEVQSTGPTQQPTHLGGQFVGIDQDRDA